MQTHPFLDTDNEAITRADPSSNNRILWYANQVTAEWTYYREKIATALQYTEAKRKTPMGAEAEYPWYAEAQEIVKLATARIGARAQLGANHVYKAYYPLETVFAEGPAYGFMASQASLIRILGVSVSGSEKPQKDSMAEGAGEGLVQVVGDRQRYRCPNMDAGLRYPDFMPNPLQRTSENVATADYISNLDYAADQRDFSAFMEVSKKMGQVIRLQMPEISCEKIVAEIDKAMTQFSLALDKRKDVRHFMAPTKLQARDHADRSPVSALDSLVNYGRQLEKFEKMERGVLVSTDRPVLELSRQVHATLNAEYGQLPVDQRPSQFMDELMRVSKVVMTDPNASLTPRDQRLHELRKRLIQTPSVAQSEMAYWLVGVAGTASPLARADDRLVTVYPMVTANR